VKRLVLRVASLAVLALCIAFFARLLLANLDRFPALTLDVPLLLTGLAVVGLVIVVYVLQILLVHLLLRGLGETPALREVTPIILLSQFAKYLPGNVGHYVGRVALGRKYGYGTQHLVFTLGYEIGWVIVVGIAISAMTVIQAGSWLHSDRLTALPPLWILAAGLIALIILPPASTVILRHWRPPVVARLLGSDSPTLPPIGITASCMLLLLLTFAINGLGLALLSQGLNGTGMDKLPLITGIFTIAWLAGFVIPGAPGGLGVREALLVAGLSPVLGEPAALLLTISSRVCFILGDGLAFVLGLIAYRASPPMLLEEEQEQP
jgi:uncharacterized membrane protein YbhN (UPF0104 family)